MNRICSVCNKEKDISEFNKSGWVDKRLRTFCKDCEHTKYRNYIEKVKKEPKSTPEFKHCKTCNTTKPSSEFGRANGKRDGLKSKCKECSREYSKKHYHQNPEKHNIRSKEYQFQHRYGLEPQLAKKLAKDNTGACEICGTVGKLAVDHCHEKVKFRGLICRNCNLMLGYAKDKIDVLHAGAEYLRQRN